MTIEHGEQDGFDVHAPLGSNWVRIDNWDAGDFPTFYAGNINNADNILDLARQDGVEILTGDTVSVVYGSSYREWKVTRDGVEIFKRCDGPPGKQTP